MLIQAKRQARGRLAHTRGHDAEGRAEAALTRDGWQVLARRLRTPAGEIDLVADRDGITAVIEVKCRPTHTAAAFALQPKQQRRLIAAAEIALAEHPAWGRAGVRFDMMLVDAAGVVRRIADAFRAETAYAA